jgi:hypothetical protein
MQREDTGVRNARVESLEESVSCLQHPLLVYTGCKLMKPLVATAPMMVYYNALFPRCHLTLLGFEHFARKIALDRSTFSNSEAIKNSPSELAART